MFLHYVFMSSSYSEHTRIAYDLILAKGQPDKKIDIATARLFTECGDDVKFSTHTFWLDVSESSCVPAYDPYFDDVKFVDSLDNFIAKIKRDRVLTGENVADYILTRLEHCSHPKLELLTCLCYTDYLSASGKKLFEDKIYKHNEYFVIDSVYGKYRKGDPIGKKVSDDYSDIDWRSRIKGRTEGMRPTDPFMRFQGRILFAEDGLEKLNYIERALKKYCTCPVSQLTEIAITAEKQL